MNKTCLAYLVSSLLLFGQVVGAEAPAPAKSFAEMADGLSVQLQESLNELDMLREQMVRETLPLSRALRDMEAELISLRNSYQQSSRLLDSRTLDLGNLRSEIKTRQEEKSYLSNLLGEYQRNFESRLHIAELRRHRQALDEARLASENDTLAEAEVFAAQAALVAASLERLHDCLGGSRFAGAAVDLGGLVRQGQMVMLGPATIFRGDDGDTIGTIEARLGSLEPTIIPFENPLDAEAAAALVAAGEGFFPLDPTLGNAHKIAATRETLVEHIRKGGPVMYPILTLAGAALLVAFYKWLCFLFVRSPSRRRLKNLLAAVAEHDRERALVEAKAVGGPTGRMLVAGVEHLKEPRELVEEVMFETVLNTRLKLNRLLPFISISAASAPLLGLLGTVTGIINTFKLITVFGSGDVKTLSGGISEALITTEFGLIVAIPSLLLHAFLSRKARGVVDQMEKSAVAFMNQLGKTPFKHTYDGAVAPSATPPADAPADAPTGSSADSSTVGEPELAAAPAV